MPSEGRFMGYTEKGLMLEASAIATRYNFKAVN